MNLNDSIQFVRGAVADKDLLPVLTHFHVEAGTIQGFDGRMVMEAPFPQLDTITVPAERFLKAVDACAGEPVIQVGDKVVVKKGSFRAVLSSMAGFPRTTLPTPYGDPAPGLIAALTLLRPFASTDASRLWSLGILVDGEGHAWATNNVILVRCPLDWTGTRINVPTYVVDELVRVGERPLSVAVSAEHQLDVFWSGGRKLRASTLTAEWPDLSPIMKQGDNWEAIPPTLLDACQTIAGLVPNSKLPILRLTAEGVETEDGEHTATIELPPGILGRYDWRMLKLVLAAATHWQQLDQVIAFKGEHIEGVFVGMR